MSDPFVDSSTPDARNLRALLVLERVINAGQPVSSSRLAQRLNIPKATLSRLLVGLVEAGFLTRYVEGDGYVAGPRATDMALATLRGGTLTRACRAVLRGLVQTLGESCNLTALDHDQVIHIERVETSHPLRFHVLPGSRHPLHCTAGGKLLLAMMPAAERGQLLARLKLKAMTARTLTTAGPLRDALLRIGETQVGIDDEEYIQGMIGVSVPVFNAQGVVTAAIVCHAAKARTDLSGLLGHVPALRLAAREMAALVA